ncbi:YraN family protein [Leptospira sp. 96542]|nr:YraN family protein [Leptospira sp. 96542]
MISFTKTQKGKLGEIKAVEYLRSIGHTILFTNFRNRFGEIDIISFHSGCLFCLEVKSWKQSSKISPIEIFNETKKRKMRKLYIFLLKKYPPICHLTVSFGLVQILEKREVRFYSSLF